MNLLDLLGQKLRQTELDLIDVIRIPSGPDRLLKLRTLEEALQEFDTGNEDNETQSYLIQVKPKAKASPMAASDQQQNSQDPQQIYHADGTLNIGYLMKNAAILTQCGDYALAQNIYLKIANSGNGANATSQALSALAGCHQSQGNTEQARHYYEQAIAFLPSLDTYQKLANLLIRQKKDRPAADVIERSLNIKDLSQEIRFDLLKTAGQCWMRVSEMASAERCLKKALDINPSADEIQACLGELYLRAGKYNDARRKFQDTLACNHNNDQAIAGLGYCLLQEGKKREAHDSFARSLDLNLNNAQALYQLVKCAYELKTYATAARIVENYIEVAPVNISLMYSLAGLQFHLGRMSDSQQTLNQILHLSPAHSGAKDLLRRIENLNCQGGQV